MKHRLPRAVLASAIALVLVAGASTTALAQSATIISGRVTNSRTQEPVASATVLVDATQIGAITADDGRYTLTVPAGRTGTVNLTARLIGYRAMHQAVTLTGGRVTADFALTSQPAQLSEVIVTALSPVSYTHLTLPTNREV